MEKVVGRIPLKYQNPSYIPNSRLKSIIYKIGYDYEIDIVELEIPVDHIHKVVRGVPKMSPSDVMQIIKSISARQFFKFHPEIKRRYFWGRKLWTQSYFVETIGNATEKVIRKYVQDQLVELDKKREKCRSAWTVQIKLGCLRPSSFIICQSSTPAMEALAPSIDL
nr:IS200/IS605 family transposase [Parashewanella hymeniacidonis]